MRTSSAGLVALALLASNATLTVAQNQPLFIIDGIRINAPTEPRGILDNAIQADMIKGIEVVRGAAATMQYGERARGGVVLVTTTEAPDTTPASCVARARSLAALLSAGYAPPPSRMFIDPPPTPEDLRTAIVVVDSLVMRRDAMSDSAVNRLDIDTIEVVVRETAAELYGTRAATAGVIVITTRRPEFPSH